MIVRCPRCKLIQEYMLGLRQMRCQRTIPNKCSRSLTRRHEVKPNEVF